MIRATPFHARTAAANRRNRWTEANGFTVPACYGEVAAEALAARAGVAMADISWQPCLVLEGARAGAFASRLLTRDAGALEPGRALDALWLNDRGALRGLGTMARYGREAFRLFAMAEDRAWIAAAAALFEVEARDATGEEAALALTGPFAASAVASAGLDASIARFAFHKRFWRGVEITLSRFGGGYEIRCAPDDALVVWDRIARAAMPFALRFAGREALAILDMEAGVPCPGRDYAPARRPDDTAPDPRALGLDALIDAGHWFNGRGAWLAAGAAETFCGILIDSDMPAPHRPLLREGRVVGRTLGSLYSPALRSAMALANLAKDAAVPGMRLLLENGVAATVAPLPFLPAPG